MKVGTGNQRVELVGESSSLLGFPDNRTWIGCGTVFVPLAQKALLSLVLVARLEFTSLVANF